MYGTGAGAHDWESEVTRAMTDIGFKQGKASPCVFWHRQREIKALFHGDDFVSSVERTELEWLCKGLEEEVRDEDDRGGRGRRPGQGGKSAEPNREMAPAKRDVRPVPSTRKLSVVIQEQRNIAPSQHQPRKKRDARHEEEKRQDLNERGLSGKLGDKMDDDNNGDTLTK